MALPEGYSLIQPKSAVSNQAMNLPEGYFLIGGQSNNQEKTPPSQYGSAVPQLDASGAPIRQDAMPGPREQPRGMLDYAVGLPEAALAFGSGAVGSVVAPYAGVASTFFGGKYGTQEGAREGEAVANRVQQTMTYQPSSRTGQQITGATGEALQGLGLEAIPFAQGMQTAAMAPAALRQGTNAYVRGVAKTSEAIENIPIIKARTEATAAKNLSESYKNAAKIEAAQLAEKHNVLINPDISNPTAKNRIKGAIAGDQNVSEKMAEKNQFTFNKVAREDVGIPETKILNAKTFDEAHAAPELTAPYKRAKSIPKINIYDDVLAEIDSLKTKDLLGDTAENAAQLNKYIDDVKAKIAAGGDGNLFVDSARQLRKESQDIYSKQHAPGGLSVTERNLADAKMGLADAVESLILDSLPLKDRNAFLKAREQHAKLYTLEQATNLATGQVEPKFFAKMIDDRKPVSGNMRDLGLIVANNPDIAGQAAKQHWSIPRITRATLPGLIGGAVGTSIGGPLLGTAIGLTLGTAAGAVGRRVLTKNMLSPKYQSKNAVPKDYRPQPTVNALRPAEPGQSNIVPFDPRNAVMPPETPGPNFIFGRPDADVRANIPQGPAQLPSPSPQSTLESLRNEDIRAGRMSRRDGQAQEQAAMAAEAAAPRASAGAGIQFDLDPITGRLQPTSRGLPGASLDVVEYANKNLTSAAQKLSGTYDSTLFQTVNTGRVDATGAPIMETIRVQKELGGKRQAQGFQLTAAEKVAFDRTKIDLAIIDPKFKSLSDKEIAAKMFERSSVEDLIQKAKDQAIGFEEIARRSNDQKLIFDANANRQRMLDLAEDLEANLSAPRAKEAAKVKGQGLKTREAITNRLRGGDNVNNLRE